MTTGIQTTIPGMTPAAMGPMPPANAKAGTTLLPKDSKTVKAPAPGLLSRGVSAVGNGLCTLLKYGFIGGVGAAACYAGAFAPAYFAYLTGAGAAAMQGVCPATTALSTVVTGTTGSGWGAMLGGGFYGAAAYRLSSHLSDKHADQKLSDLAKKHNAELKAQEEKYDAKLKDQEEKSNAKFKEQDKKFNELIAKQEELTNQKLVSYQEGVKKEFGEKEKEILSEKETLKRQQEIQATQIQTLKEQLEAKDEELTRQSFSARDKEMQSEYPVRNNRGGFATEDRGPAGHGEYRGESALYGNYNRCYLNLFTPVFTHCLNINPWFYTPVFTPAVIPYVWV